MTKDEKKQETITLVLDRYTAARNWRKENFDDNWAYWYELYRGIHNGTDETQAKVFVPECFRLVETLVPRLCGDYLNTQQPFVSAIARRIEFVAKMESVDNLLFYQFQRMMFGLKNVNHVKQATIFGSSIAKLYWDFSMKTTKRRTPVIDPVTRAQEIDLETGEKKYAEEEKTSVDYDDPQLEIIDITDFFIDPAATTIDDARFCIHRKLVTKKSLEEMQRLGVYKNVGDVQDTYDTGDSEEDDHKLIPFAPEDDFGEKQNRHELLEYWEDNRIIVLIDRMVIVRDDPNPFDCQKKPFFNLQFIPVPGEFYGIGLIEPIASLQWELNEKRNLRLDYLTRVLYPMFLVRRGAIEDPAELVAEAGGIISLNDINSDLRELQLSLVVPYNSKEEELLKKEIQDATGVNDLLSGTPSSDRATATEMNLKTQQADTRYQFTFKFQAAAWVCPIAQRMLEYDQQFLDTDKQIRITGPNGYEFPVLTPEDIEGDYDFFPCVDPGRMNKEVHRQQFTVVYDKLSQRPPQMINQLELDRALLDKFEVQNAEKILTPSPPIPAPPVVAPPGIPAPGGPGGILMPPGPPPMAGPPPMMPPPSQEPPVPMEPPALGDILQGALQT